MRDDTTPHAGTRGGDDISLIHDGVISTAALDTYGAERKHMSTTIKVGSSLHIYGAGVSDEAATVIDLDAGGRCRCNGRGRDTGMASANIDLGQCCGTDIEDSFVLNRIGARATVNADDVRITSSHRSLIFIGKVIIAGIGVGVGVCVS